MQEHELVIIGAGPAGTSAGIYARRAGLDVLLLESGNGGSQPAAKRQKTEEQAGSGSEGEGLSRLVREKCDFLAAVPMSGKIGSLNASVAAAVLMFEKRRQDART